MSQPTFQPPESRRAYIPPPPTPPKKTSPWVIVGIIAGSLLLLLVLLGACVAALSGPGSSTAPDVPAATVTATETAPAETIEKTPQACLDALDYADDGFGLAAKVIGYMEPAINAVLELDTAKIRQITRKIDAASTKMSKLSPKYNAAKAECRAGQ